MRNFCSSFFTRKMKTRVNKLNSFVFLSVFLVFKQSHGQVLQFGVCPEVSTMEYFSLDKFLGKWYEIERFPSWYEEYGNCAFKMISSCGKNIEIEHGFVRDGIQYILHLNSSYSPGAEAVFIINKSNIDPVGIPLTVITTDYSNYAVVYGCKSSSLLGIKYISAWILSREPTLPDDILEKARQELNAVPNAYNAYLEAVPQIEESCLYYWTAHVDAEIKEDFENELRSAVRYEKDYIKQC